MRYYQLLGVFAFGSTSYQSGRNTAEVSLKRYRYTGKERDEETGLYYHGARYYVPWLCRWMAVDPLESKYAPQSPYVYCSDNPVIKVDPDGMGEKDKSTPQPATRPVAPNLKPISFSEQGHSAVDNTAATGQQQQVNLSLGRDQLIKLYGVPYVPSGLTNTTTIHADPTTGYTPQQQQAHEQSRQARLNATGDPNRAPFKYSTSGRRAVEGANAMLDKTITLATIADGVGILKNSASLLSKEAITATTNASVDISIAIIDKRITQRASVGFTTSTNYRGTFFTANPTLEGQVIVHHAVEQQTLIRFPTLFSEGEIHSLENLRGIPNSLNSDLHLSQIRRSWNQFYRITPNPTMLDMLNKVY